MPHFLQSKNEALVGVPPDNGLEDDRKVAETKGATTDGTTISWFHAAARAISGGPVYVSDRLGQARIPMAYRWSSVAGLG